jgi:hypothetical protein
MSSNERSCVMWGPSACAAYCVGSGGTVITAQACASDRTNQVRKHLRSSSPRDYARSTYSAMAEGSGIGW